MKFLTEPASFWRRLSWKLADNASSNCHEKAANDRNRKHRRNTDLAAKRVTSHRQKFSRAKFLVLVSRRNDAAPESPRAHPFARKKLSRRCRENVARTMAIKIQEERPLIVLSSGSQLSAAIYRYPCTYTRCIHTRATILPLEARFRWSDELASNSWRACKGRHIDGLGHDARVVDSIERPNEISQRLKRPARVAPIARVSTNLFR